jgi:hypothetical protein
MERIWIKKDENGRYVPCEESEASGYITPLPEPREDGITYMFTALRSEWVKAA